MNTEKMKAQEIVNKISNYSKQLKVDQLLKNAKIPKMNAMWPPKYEKETSPSKR